jgi:hypothetical protein
MSEPPPPASRSSNSQDPAARIAALVQEARGHFARRNPRKAIDALHQAHQLASQQNLHPEASRLRRALAILANGGRPKLLAGQKPL